MTPEELRSLISFLEQRVDLTDPDGCQLRFDQPGEAELVAAGFEAAAVHRLVTASWWPEMAEEIMETADFCEPDEQPEQVLRYARDVVAEYLRKRFSPSPTSAMPDRRE